MNDTFGMNGFFNKMIIKFKLQLVGANPLEKPEAG